MELAARIKQLARMTSTFMQELTDAGVGGYAAVELTKQYMYLVLSMAPPTETMGTPLAAEEIAQINQLADRVESEIKSMEDEKAKGEEVKS